MAVAVPTAAGSPAEDSLSLGGVSARKAALLVGTAVLLVVSLVLLAPTFADMSATWERLRDGSHGWLALALLFAVLSFAGHVILFAGVAGRGGRTASACAPRSRSTSPPTRRPACSPAPAPAGSR